MKYSSTQLSIFLGFFFILIFSSCNKYESSSALFSVKMEALRVSSSFDWKTARVVSFTINNLPQGVVRISSGDGSKLFYKGYNATDASTYQISVSIPTTEKKIQINDDVVTIPSNNSLNYTMINLKSIAMTNYSMFFSGTSSYIKFQNTASTVFTTVTMSAWVKLTAQQTSKIVEKGDWNGFGLSCDLYKGFGAGVYLKNSSGSNILWGSNQPVLNHWYYLAMTFDGTTLCLYVDGVLRNTSTTTSGMWGNTYPITIGSDSGNQKFVKGYIDEVSIWTVALSAAQVAANMNMPLVGNETGLYAYYQFNEGSGTTVYDKTTHHYDGPVTNATWSTDVSFGPDSDGDGVVDAYDDYPNDPTKAFNNYFPALGFGSLAFEDLWPAKGDYDFNDLVVDYQFKTITNARNKVAEIDATFIIRAAGAEYENGFGFQLPEQLADANITVTGSKINHNVATLKSNGTESGQAKTTVIVYDDVFDLMQNPGQGIGFNTSPGAPYVTPDTLRMTMTFKADTYLATDINIENFNPFLIVNKTRGKEVHLPDYPPTSLADVSLFGTLDDNSSVATGHYYKTVNNLPWALNINSSYSYTNETVQITSGYKYFAPWAQSGGTASTDWYLDLSGYRNAANIYKH